MTSEEHNSNPNLRCLPGVYYGPIELLGLLRLVQADDSRMLLHQADNVSSAPSGDPSADAKKVEGVYATFCGSEYRIGFGLVNRHSDEDGGGKTVLTTTLRRGDTPVLLGELTMYYTTAVDGSEDYELGREMETRVLDCDQVANQAFLRMHPDG